MTLAMIPLLLSAFDDSPTIIRLFTTLDGTMTAKVGDKLGELHSFTKTDFTLARKGDEVALQFLRNELDVQSGGQSVNRTVFSAAGIENAEQGKPPQKTPFAEAKPELKSILKRLFDEAVCEVTFDKDGNELRRNIPPLPPVADGLARTLIVNCLFFQPPYFQSQDFWTSERVLSHDNRMQLRGELRYERRPSPKGLPSDYRMVEVAGILKGVPIQTGAPADDLLQGFKSHAKGTQIFDLKRRTWVWGEIHFNVETKAKDRDEDLFGGLLIYRLGEPWAAALDVPAVIESTSPSGSFKTTSSTWLLQGRRADGLHRFRGATVPGTLWAKFLTINSEAEFKSRVDEAAKRSAGDFEFAALPKESNDKPRPALVRWRKQGTVRRKDAPAFYLAQSVVWSSETKTGVEITFEAKMLLSQSFSSQREEYLNESLDAMTASFK